MTGTVDIVAQISDGLWLVKFPDQNYESLWIDTSKDHISFIKAWDLYYNWLEERKENDY
jgi:hypothetical protein